MTTFHAGLIVQSQRIAGRWDDWQGDSWELLIRAMTHLALARRLGPRAARRYLPELVKEAAAELDIYAEEAYVAAVQRGGRSVWPVVLWESKHG